MKKFKKVFEEVFAKKKWMIVFTSYSYAENSLPSKPSKAQFAIMRHTYSTEEKAKEHLEFVLKCLIKADKEHDGRVDIVDYINDYHVVLRYNKNGLTYTDMEFYVVTKI